MQTAAEVTKQIPEPISNRGLFLTPVLLRIAALVMVMALAHLY